MQHKIKEIHETNDKYDIRLSVSRIGKEYYLDYRVVNIKNYDILQCLGAAFFSDTKDRNRRYAMDRFYKEKRNAIDQYGLKEG